MAAISNSSIGVILPRQISGCPHDSVPSSEAYVTLFGGKRTDDAFSGLRVLVHTIRKHDACRPMIVMVPEGSGAQRAKHVVECEFGSLGVRTVEVPPLTSTVPSCLKSLTAWAGNRTSVARYAFTVYNAWRLTQFERLLWLEQDQMLLRPLEELWQRPLDQASAGAAVLVMEFMPMCNDKVLGLKAMPPKRRLKFNSGVVLMRPSLGVFTRLRNALLGVGVPSYECTDGFQTLWNLVLHRQLECLHRSYNCLNIRYIDAPGASPSRSLEPPAWEVTPAYNHSKVKLSCLRQNETSPHVVHYAGGQPKPWVSVPTLAKSWSRLLWRSHLGDAHRYRNKKHAHEHTACKSSYNTTIG